MLAARLLGIRQFGLSSLVESILGMKLDKGPQKADWARRPLTERMETYARNDTHHLKPLANRLTADLTEKQRLDWHRESCARLIADCTQPPPDNSDTVWRVKGSHGLIGPRWRCCANSGNGAKTKPSPRTVRHFSFSRTKSSWPLPSHGGAAGGRAVVAATSFTPTARRHRQGNQGRIDSPAGHASADFAQLHAASVRSRAPPLSVLEQRRDAAAHHLGIDATIIASRSVLGDLARDWDKHAPELMNWQRQLLQP